MAPLWKLALLATLLTPQAASYILISNCVPGSVIEGHKQTQGKIGLYATVLKDTLPELYGDLKLLAVGPRDKCLETEQNINQNSVLLRDIMVKFPDMNLVDIPKALHKAQRDRSYLFVFHNKYHVNYPFIGNCVPGGIVKQLNQTRGKIGLYSMALKMLLPNLMGDLVYLGSGSAASCITGMNNVNEGNLTFLHSAMTHQTYQKLHKVGLVKALSTADDDINYLYVFRNKMWNSTYHIMDGDWN
eukprot:TRINITY_DN96337_c0_g1_i1.p1 TRINITY_DN96337_c0_g1~~TRINITY_DN96337_c0_g1_i1.p1  ORF type:complete len:275 (+),score=32.34 TRINITY_DN96337_c0_g1_i1:95-826(+)